MGLLQDFERSLGRFFGSEMFLHDERDWDTHTPIAELLPYRTYDQDERLFNNKNSHGFLLEASPLVGADEATVNVLTGMITDALPKGCSVVFLNWASPKIGPKLARWRQARQETGGIYAGLGDRRFEFFEGGGWNSVVDTEPMLLRHFRLFIAVSLPGAPDARSIASLQGFRKSFISTLRAIGVHSVNLEPPELLELLEEIVLPDDDPFPRTSNYSSLDLINGQLSDPEVALRVRPGRLETAGDREYEIRCFTPRSLPEMWAQWQMARLIGDPFRDHLRMVGPFLSVFGFTATDEVASANAIGVKAVRATQQSGSGAARYIPSMVLKERDLKFVAKKLADGQKLVKAFSAVMVYSRKGEGEAAEEAVRAVFKASGWQMSREYFVQLQTFLASLPFMLSEGLSDDLIRLKRMKTHVTWTCANLAPLQGEWRGLSRPALLLVGRRGELFFWNPFENPSGNYNVAVIGKSGSGKSVAMQEMAAALVGAGGRVIVVDDGRSAENSCRLQGGSFVEFSANAGLCINPFSLMNADAYERDQDYREDTVQLINQMIRQMCRPHTKTDEVENAFIHAAVLAAWEAKRDDASISTVQQQLAAVEDPRARDLAMMLGPYAAGGLYERLFEGRCNLKIDNKLVVFELAELKKNKELQGIVLLVIMFLVTEAMYFSDRTCTTSLFIDEAWDLLHGASTGDFVEGVARRARKYLGNLVTGTQGIDDYYKNPAAKACLDNSDFTVYLAQKPESILQAIDAKKIVGDAMERNLRSLKMVEGAYSEMMIVGPEYAHIGRLVLDPWSVALYSSKGEDFARIKEAMAAGQTLEEAIDLAAADIARRRGKSYRRGRQLDARALQSLGVEK